MLSRDVKLITTSAREVFNEKSVQQCAISIDSKNHYIQAYPLLLESTKILCKELGEKAIPAIAHLAYGWMPRIPRSLNYERETNTRILNALEINCIDESVKFIRSWRTPPINNSWVGSSKVLHLINPGKFPIWDSRVAEHFVKENGKKLTEPNIRLNSKYYADYVEFCKDISDSCSSICKIQKAFETRAEYGVTKFRAIEYVLFSTNKHT